MSTTNPNFDVLRAYIAGNEGYRTSVYTDTQGNKTVGIGFNLQQSGAQKQIENLGVNYQQLCSGQVVLTNGQVDSLFEDSVNNAIQGAQATVSNFSSLVPARQIVVVDMVFNLGESKFSGFHQMIAALEAGNWDEAATQMLNSLWYDQVGERGQRDVGSMKLGALLPMANNLS